MGWFKKNLINLLPPLYLQRDEKGELSNYINQIAEIFDELNHKADNFKKNINIEKAHEKYLTKIAFNLGIERGKIVTKEFRNKVFHAVGTHRRKGSMGTLQLDLERNKQKNQKIYVDEPFRLCAKNGQSRLGNELRLAGKIYNHGIFRIHTNSITDKIKSIAKYHQPAGTKFFFVQWNTNQTEIKKEVSCEKPSIKAVVTNSTKIIPFFILDHDRLNKSSLISSTRQAVKKHYVNKNINISFMPEWTGFTLDQKRLDSSSIDNFCGFAKAKKQKE